MVTCPARWGLQKNVQQLTQHRVQTQYELLDFGELEPASPQALADNACEAMALGIESGLSYLLPMLYNQGLLEHYPKHHPIKQWL